MTNAVNEELTHIPKVYGDYRQAELRMVYNSSRRNRLKIGKSKEETLLFCIEHLKKDNPSWQPSYDRNFFNI